MSSTDSAHVKSRVASAIVLLIIIKVNAARNVIELHVVI